MQTIIHSKKAAGKAPKDVAQLIGFSRQMQKEPTPSEAIALRVLTEAGIEPETQVVFGFYILDFVVVSKLLVIEIDGTSHNDRSLYDWKRDKFAKKHGLKVLRLTAAAAKYAAIEAAKIPDATNARERWRAAQSAAIREQSGAADSRQALPATGRSKDYVRPLYTPKRKQAHNVQAIKRSQHLANMKIDSPDTVAQRKRDRETRRSAC